MPTSVYTPQDAIDLVRKFVRDAPSTSVDAQLCDVVHSTIWTAYPWSWAQASLTAISLTDGTQDYSLSNTSDFFQLLRVRIVCTSATPDEYNDKITIRDFLPPDLSKAGMWNIGQAAYLPITEKIRLERALSLGSGETAELQGEYWKTPTTIVNDALDTAFAFPDRYFPVFVHGLKWATYDLIGDSRAGTAQTDRNGRRIYTGQLGIFMDSIQNMAVSEDYGDEGSEYPDNPIGNRDMGGLGLYG